MSNDKELSAASTNNRPSRLVESDYESLKIRIERYIRVTEGQGAAAVQVTRDKTDEGFTEIENNRELADIQATNILSQGHVSRHCKEKKRVKDSQYLKYKMLLMEAKEKRAVLDAEAEALPADVECTAPYDQPLAITTSNIFEVSHEDAYDSDVDEGPHAVATFMSNLSSTSGTNGATTSHVNEGIQNP
nr:hypothetical protein [Tanacetum cinerariifolium]